MYYKLLIFLIILFVNNYCFSKQATSKVAVVGPFTGFYSSYGRQLLTATHKAIIDINNPNNLLDIIPFDDQCNSDLAKSVANKIILDSNIKAVIGHVCQGATMAASKIYAQHGLLHLVPTTTSSKLTEQNIATLFRMCGTDNSEAQTISNFILKQFGNKKIAILHSQDLYGKQLASLVQEYLVTLKIFPTLYQSVTIDSLNNPIKTKTIIKKLKKLNIDIIFFGGLYKEIANLVKIMNNHKIKIPIIAPDSIATKGFIEALVSPKIAAGTIMSFQKLDPNFIPKNIIDLNIFGYAAIQVLNTALENNPSTNSRILAHWLHQNKVNTILGEKSWDTSGNIINDEFAIYIWNSNGKFLEIN